MEHPVRGDLRAAVAGVGGAGGGVFGEAKGQPGGRQEGTVIKIHVKSSVKVYFKRVQHAPKIK